MEPPQREPRTYQAYKHCLEVFTNNCAKEFIQDVKREDVLAFIRKLYELGCGPRTAYNRAVIVSQLLKANGITKLLRSEEHTSELQSHLNLVCRLLLEKKKNTMTDRRHSSRATSTMMH